MPHGGVGVGGRGAPPFCARAGATVSGVSNHSTCRFAGFENKVILADNNVRNARLNEAATDVDDRADDWEG